MNRSTRNGHLLAVGESRMGRLPSHPASANRYRWWAVEVAAFTADLRRLARLGNRQRPGRQPAPARAAHHRKVRLARRRKEDRHANYRITLDMYADTTADILGRARQATQ